MLIDYLINLMSKVIQSKHKIMHKYMRRNDHQTLLVSEPKDKKQTAELCRSELAIEKKEKHLEDEKKFLNEHVKHFDYQWHKYGNAVKYLLLACDNKDRKILELNARAKQIQKQIDELRQAKILKR